MTADTGLTLIAHDTSDWTAGDIAEFMRYMTAWMAREYRGSPGKLCIDGHEYRRRQRARRRRKR